MGYTFYRVVRLVIIIPVGKSSKQQLLAACGGADITTSWYCNFCLLQFVRLIVIAEAVVHYNIIMHKIGERV